MTKEAAEKADREAAEREAIIARAAVEAYIADQKQKREEESEESTRMIKEAAD